MIQHADIPLLANPSGTQCLQMAVLMALHPFVQTREITLAMLIEGMKKREPYFTYTYQAVAALNQLQVRTAFYTTDNIEDWRGGEEYVHRTYSAEDAAEIIKYTDWPVMFEALNDVIVHQLWQQHHFTTDEMKSALTDGHMVVVLVDSNSLNNLAGPTIGHYITLTGFEDDYFYYHDCGSNKKPALAHVAISARQLEAARTVPTGHDTIIIKG